MKIKKIAELARHPSDLQIMITLLQDLTAQLRAEIEAKYPPRDLKLDYIAKRYEGEMQHVVCAERFLSDRRWLYK